MPVQTEHRFSVEDYHRMSDAGVLGPTGMVELLNGRIIDMSPIGPFHGGVVKRLSRLFQLKAKARWIVSTQDPLLVDPHSEPQPDIMLLKPATDDYINHHPGPQDVLLLIEVADTSVNYDREDKLPAYARAGIPEVWIVNLNEINIEVHREPGFTGYATRTVLLPGAKVNPFAFPDIVIDVAELLKR